MPRWPFSLGGSYYQARVSVSCSLSLLSHYYTTKENTAIKYQIPIDYNVFVIMPFTDLF